MQRPPSVEVETLDGMATVILRVPSGTSEREGATFYQYDEYYVPAIYRDNLKADVESHFDAWLAMARKDAAPAMTIEQRVEAVESEVATVAELVDAIFGGGE